MKYFTDEMKQRIKKLLLEYADIENTKFQSDWNNFYECIKLEIPLNFPYDIKLASSSQDYNNSLHWYRNCLNKNKKDGIIVLFNGALKNEKLTKTIFKQLVNMIDLDEPISKLDTIFLELLVYSQSFEKSNLKEYTGQPFGSGELKRFLKKNGQFYIVRNLVAQSYKPMALVTENNDYITISYKEYIKLFSEFENCEITNQINDLL